MMRAILNKSRGQHPTKQQLKQAEIIGEKMKKNSSEERESYSKAIYIAEISSKGYTHK